MLKVRWLAIRGFLALLAFGLLALLAPETRAGGDSGQAAVNRAHGFLKTAKRGRDILGYVHAFTKYRNHSYTETRLANRAGRQVPGHFALLYKFEWAEDGETTLAFLCDGKGRVYEVQTVKSNGELNRPFKVAEATIKLLGTGLLNALRDDLTKADRDFLQRLVDSTNVRGLLEWGLRLEQRLGR